MIKVINKKEIVTEEVLNKVEKLSTALKEVVDNTSSSNDTKKLVKFVIGRGNGSKALMLKYVYKKWGYDTEIDDLADAYSLARYVFEEYKG